MIPEAPFLFSIAGLSASLAGLAGLVAGLRRGADVRPIDLFRLRQIVEFSFANVLLALSVIPLSELNGLDGAIRVVAVLGIVYVVVSSLILQRRMHHAGIAWTTTWQLAASGLNLVAIGLAVAAIATLTFASVAFMLMALLGRPMLAFLLVLGSFEDR
jgi:hypothetical protein